MGGAWRMRRLRAWALAALLALALPAQAALPGPVAAALQAQGIPAESVAVFVQQVDARAPLLAHHADAAMNPASAMKLLTTYAGLELLGPAHTWQTEIHATAPPRGEVLEGDLILKGYGDPALTQEHFWSLVRTLRQKGVRVVRGDLVLDQSYFVPTDDDPGAFDGELHRPYNTLPGALLVNFGVTRFDFAGDAQEGRVRIGADPDMAQLRIVNQLALSHVPCADWQHRLGYRVQREGGEVVVVFSGGYSLACGEQSLNLSLFDHAVYVEQLFRRLWREQGGEFEGALRSGAVPEGARLLVRATSPPLAEVVRRINKHSNNVMARQMLISLGAAHAGAPGSAAAGAAAIRQWLAGKGLEFPELVIDNGAGLSRIERISARHLGELLLAAYASPVMPELISSLPIVAVDGTLQRRLQGSPLAGRGHLKTGSLDGVRAIAGYLMDARGRRWVVVCLVNDPRAAASRAAQDALLEWLHAR